MLDATLLANGVETFLAERDILIGDSIPESIYAGIAKATDLIYVISAKSVNSTWVQEELSIGKMKQKQSMGFRIFPVVIDDLELPMSVLHIKYADFRCWRESQAYRQQCLELLDAMGIAPRLIGRYELRWWSARADKLRDIDRRINNAAGVLWGGLDATQGGTDQEAHYAPTKYTFEDGIVESLHALCGMIEDRDVLGSDRLRTLREEVQRTLAMGQEIHGDKKAYRDRSVIDHFAQGLRRTSSLLEELRTELEVSLLSTVPTETLP